MPHTKVWAKQLLRELPDDPQEVLRRRSYADLTFLPLFFDWLDELIYQHPQEGLKWARIAPELAQKIPEEDGPEEQQEGQVRAWTILGGAFRSCSEDDAASAAHRKARKLAASPKVTDLVRTDTDRRLSTLWADRGRLDEALALAAGALEKLRKIEDAPLGDALVALGYVLANGRRYFKDRDALGEAIEAFGEALALAGAAKTPAEKRVHATACKNLAMAICESGSGIYSAREALEYIWEARKLLPDERCAERYRLQWVEAKIWDRIGCHAKAERLYLTALEGFDVLKLPWELALVGLDLAALHHLCGELYQLEKIARETYQRFRVLSGANVQTLAALSLWVDAVKARSWLAVDEGDPGRSVREYDEKYEKARHVISAVPSRSPQKRSQR